MFFGAFRSHPENILVGEKVLNNVMQMLGGKLICREDICQALYFFEIGGNVGYQKQLSPKPLSANSVGLDITSEFLGENSLRNGAILITPLFLVGLGLGGALGHDGVLLIMLFKRPLGQIYSSLK